AGEQAGIGRGPAHDHNRGGEAGDGGGKELLERGADHLVGEAGMQAAGAGNGFGGDESGGEHGRAGPPPGIGGRLAHRIEDEARLQPRGHEGEPGGGGEGGGAVAAELGGAGHLAADGGDLVERVAKLVHGPSFTLYRKASAASSGSTGCDCFRERWRAYTGEDGEVAQRGAYRGGVCRLWHAELLLPLPRRPGERVRGHGPAAGDDRVHRGPGWAGDLFRAAVAG